MTVERTPWLPLFFGLLLGCSPGTGSVYSPDARLDATQPDSSNNSTERDASPADVNAPPGDATNVRDAREPPPDLPTPPSRVWTAETDGSIAWWTFDPDTGSLNRDGQIERGGTLNFLTFSSDRSKLYAINQNRVEAFDIRTVPPTFIGDADAGVAGNGTHLAVDNTGSHVFVAWYGGNAVSMLPLDPDGAPMDATLVLGTDADPGFCQRAHQIRIHPDNGYVYVPCLGSDHVAVLAYDSTAGTLNALAPAAAPSGSGPRHMAFHPTLPQAFVIGELDDTITRYEVDAVSGEMSQAQSISTRPNAGDPLGPASDVHVSPDGNWVVGINRNPRDEVVSFALGSDGSMSDGRWVSTGGEHARTFAFSPAGGHLVVGNSNSMSLTVFRFDSGDASLIGTTEGFDARVFFVGFE